MDLKKLESLVSFAKEHGIHEIEVEQDKVKVRITLNPPQYMLGGGVGISGAGSLLPNSHQQFAPTGKGGSTDANSKGGGDDNRKLVRSPFVGTFYAAPSPGAEPFVSAGSQVKKGQKLCIVEAMKLMNEIDAEHAMRITEILVKNGEPVQFDQPLFVYES